MSLELNPLVSPAFVCPSRGRRENAALGNPVCRRGSASPKGASTARWRTENDFGAAQIAASSYWGLEGRTSRLAGRPEDSQLSGPARSFRLGFRVAVTASTVEPSAPAEAPDAGDWGRSGESEAGVHPYRGLANADYPV